MAYIYKDTEHLRVRPHYSMISYDIHDLSISYSVHTSRIERKKNLCYLINSLLSAQQMSFALLIFQLSIQKCRIHKMSAC